MSSDPSHYGRPINDCDDGTEHFGHSRRAWPRKSAAEIGCEIPKPPPVKRPPVKRPPLGCDWDDLDEPLTDADRWEIRREQIEAINGDPLRWRRG